jgi:LacI family transcriptional regulator, repressor for deo operon, udp, cdd, tsx, nupC, and nupG
MQKATTRVSIKDIAKAAGVSHSTVSRALANSPLVNTKTRTRIQRIAQEVGYSPDAWARSLVMGQTRTVGVVVTTITDPFIAEVVQGIESTAYEHGYTVILVSSNFDPAREMAAVEMLHSKRVDGVIVTSSRVGAFYQSHLERMGVPVVLLNNHSEQSGHYMFSVTVDNQHGGHLATQHLIELGHRRIAYVTGPAGTSSSEGRLAGYQQALAEARIPFDPALVVQGTGRAEGGEQALPKLMSLSLPPTAVFCYNDVTAIGLMRKARESNVLVPGDLAVVGFDDIPFASCGYQSLTTIAQPKLEMGQQAMQMLLALMATPSPAEAQVTDIVVQGQLIIRESSGAPRDPTNQ